MNLDTNRAIILPCKSIFSARAQSTIMVRNPFVYRHCFNKRFFHHHYTARQDVIIKSEYRIGGIRTVSSAVNLIITDWVKFLSSNRAKFLGHDFEKSSSPLFGGMERFKTLIFQRNRLPTKLSIIYTAHFELLRLRAKTTSAFSACSVVRNLLIKRNV